MIKLFRLAAAVSLLAALSGCALMPQSPGHTSLRSYCRQAAKEGWCSAYCGRRQPVGCGPRKVISCSDLMCVSEDADGNLFFGAFVAPGR